MKKIKNWYVHYIQKLFLIASKEEFLTLDCEFGPFSFRNKDTKGYKNILGVLIPVARPENLRQVN